MYTNACKIYFFISSSDNGHIDGMKNETLSQDLILQCPVMGQTKTEHHKY